MNPLYYARLLREGGGEYFSIEHNQKKFLCSVGTGLISDHIKFQLRPYLDDSKISDEIN